MRIEGGGNDDGEDVACSCSDILYSKCEVTWRPMLSETAEMSNTVARAASISRIINFFLRSTCFCLLVDG